MTSRFSELIQILIIVVVVKVEGEKFFGWHVRVRAELLSSCRNGFNVEDEWTKNDKKDERKFWQHSWLSFLRFFSISALTQFIKVLLGNGKKEHTFKFSDSESKISRTAMQQIFFSIIKSLKTRMSFKTIVLFRKDFHIFEQKEKHSWLRFTFWLGSSSLSACVVVNTFVYNFARAWRRRRCERRSGFEPWQSSSRTCFCTPNSPFSYLIQWKPLNVITG